MKPRVYIDTSVVGGYFDEEFEKDTKKFFDRVFRKDFIVYFSEISETELSLAPPHIRNLKDKIPKDCYKYIELDQESKNLAHVYISEKILGNPVIMMPITLHYLLLTGWTFLSVGISNTSSTSIRSNYLIRLI